MRVSWNCGSVLFAVVALAASASGTQSVNQARIWTPLSEPARRELASWLESCAPGRFLVEAGPSGERLGAVLREHPDVAVLLGYAQAELEALADGRSFPELPKIPDSAAHALDDSAGRVRALFADPVVLAVDLDRMTRSFGGNYPDVLPRSLVDLAGADFEGRFVIEGSAVGSVAGAVFGRAAIARGKAIDRWLEGFGKNTVGALTLSDSEALGRLDRNEEKRFAVVRRSVLVREGAALGVVQAGDVSADATHVLLGFACTRAETVPEFMNCLAIDLGQGAPALGRIAAAEGVVAVHGLVAADAEEWVKASRRALEFEAPRLRLETAAIAPTVEQFETKSKDAIARRQQRFEDVYDVAGLIAIAIVFGTFLLRRKSVETMPSP